MVQSNLKKFIFHLYLPILVKIAMKAAVVVDIVAETVCLRMSNQFFVHKDAYTYSDVF